jgi:predicted aspartyl protease
MTIPTLSRSLGLAALLMAAAAHAADDPPRCQYVQLAELPLSYTGTSLSVTTQGAINGQPAAMLVDTGASESFLSRTATERLGLSLNFTGEHSVGIGGYSRIYATRLSEFRVGPARSSRGSFSVLGDTGTAPEYDAIAGAPFLLQADMEISLAEKKLRFFKGLNCKSSDLGYWGGEIYEIPFERNFDRSPNPHLIVEVNGHKMEAIIDSGASVTTMFASAAKRAGLKLDAPGSTRLGVSVGIGSEKVARWSTIVGRLVIGAETVHDAEIGVLEADAPPGIDMLIGDDFLRTHRVLFAMSQKKFYVSYLGGTPFKQQRGVEPWLQKEAESDNADAQLVLAGLYGSGRGVPKDAKVADAWIDKAAALGQPQANIRVARKLMARHQYADAASRLRAALDRLPAERFGAFWLYVARLQSGQADVAKGELETTFARGERDEWPAPIADFYLGRIDAAALLDAAGKDKALSKSRTCSATGFMYELYAAQGDTKNADAMRASLSAHCGAAAPALASK